MMVNYVVIGWTTKAKKSWGSLGNADAEVRNLSSLLSGAKVINPASSLEERGEGWWKQLISLKIS